MESESEDDNSHPRTKFRICEDDYGARMTTKFTVIKELPNKKIIFITKNKQNNYFINSESNDENIKIDIGPDLIENNDNFIIFKDFLLIAFITSIKIFYIPDLSFENYELKIYFQIKNILSMKNNNFIISLYNSKKKETILREYHLKIFPNFINFECLGEGKFPEIIIDNLFKLKENQILTKIDNELITF